MIAVAAKSVVLAVLRTGLIILCAVHNNQLVSSIIVVLGMALHLVLILSLMVVTNLTGRNII